ncbi:MAG: toll/interleukin-1 receptor domain-containing protein [Candidatus Sulfotelmatobacter sp.]
MIFVSSSHADEKWRKQFETILKPQSRSEGIRFWSDRDIKAGEWEPQIKKAMKDAVAAVLLVSDNFLASDYIIEKELRVDDFLGTVRTMRLQEVYPDHAISSHEHGKLGGTLR